MLRAWLKKIAIALAILVGTLLAVLLLGLAVFWFWAGTDGSLATAVRFASQREPALVANGVTGAIRSGGKVETLVWQDGTGLTVRVESAQWQWQPLALLHKTLHLQSLQAAKIAIDDQRPADPQKASGPPASLALPVQVKLDGFAIASVQYSSAKTGEAAVKPVTAANLTGHYTYLGGTHRLNLTNLQAFEGQYTADVQLQGDAPFALDAKLGATRQTAVPGSQAVLPLALTATVRGPLAELLVEAQAQLLQPAGSATPQASTTASVNARIQPWASQPLAEAKAEFAALDLAALGLGLPQSALTGTASVQPAAAAASQAAFWNVEVDLKNSLPGPYDQKNLPLEQLAVKLQWQGGKNLLVESLDAAIGGGRLQATGSTVPGAPGVVAAVPDWNVEAKLEGINPALLLSTLAAWPLNGRAEVQSRSGVLGFEAQVQAVAAKASGKALAIEKASAKGSWNPQAAGGGLLRLAAVEVRALDAQLKGEAIEVAPLTALQTGGKGKAQLTAPGIQAALDGEIRPRSGAGNLRLSSPDVAQALRWLQKIPGLPPAVLSTQASGKVQLDTRWQGGWLSNPAVNAKLAVPLLAVQLTSAKAPANTPARINIRNLQANLAGSLQQAQLTVDGQAEIDQRRIGLQMAIAGGAVQAGRANAPIAWDQLGNATWQATLKQLSLSAEDPAIAKGPWQLTTRAPVDLRWTPSGKPAGRALLEASAGSALLTPPASVSSGAAGSPGNVTVATTATGAAAAPRAAVANAASALIEWQPVRWQPGQLLTSAGRISGLPIGWIESLAGPQFASSGLGGNLVFGGEWDARLTGDTLALKASVARTSGDISMHATSAEGTISRIAAGVREARIDIASQGTAINASVRWDSERAGTVDGKLSTQLERNAAGWSWPANAPLTGQLQASLPRVGVWSVLAPPGWRLRGSVAANIQVAGNRAAPQLTGTLQADDLALRSVVDGFEFGNGRLRSRLDGTRLLIDEFMLQGASSKDASGKIQDGSGGQLIAKGQAAWVSGAPDVQLSASINRLRASIRTDRQLTVSGDVEASLKGKDTRVTGKLRVDQASILLPDEATPQLGDDVVVRGVGNAGTSIGSGKKGPEQASAPNKAAEPVAASQPGSLNLAVQLALGDNFRVQGKGIDTRIRGSLDIASNAFGQPPRLTGTVNTEGGIFRAYGQRLNIERGTLRFTGPVDNPSLDILAVRPVALTASDPQRVGVQVSGTALLPRVRLYAQPELPEAEKLSWLVLGRPSAGGGAEAALLQQAALALLGSKGGGTSGGLAASLGLDELSYKGASGDGVAGGAVTLGKRFSENFYAAYERSISGATGTLFVFYDISKRFTVRAQTGTQSAVDLIFTFDFN